MSCPVRGIGLSATVAVLATVSLEPSTSTMKTWIENGSGAAVDARIGVGVGAADDECGPDAAWLADGAGGQRGAIAPVDGGLEVWLMVEEGLVGASVLASVKNATGP